MDTTEHNDLEASAIVAAHPDDEILWFSSIFEDVDQVILCFGDVPGNSKWSRGRRKALEAYPTASVTSLGIPEAGVFSAINWQEPVQTDFGLEITGNDKGRETYEANCRRLRDVLRTRLEACKNVFTHNPWGEYGNAEHVQVFRAVLDVSSELGFAVWIPGYFSNKSAPLMAACSDYLGDRAFSRPTNRQVAESIAEIYKKFDCWTWFTDYRWPDKESFCLADASRSGPGAPGSTWTMHCIVVDPAGSPVRPRKRPGLLRRAGRKLSRWFGHA